MLCDKNGSQQKRVTIQHTKEASGEEQNAAMPPKGANPELKQHPAPRHHPSDPAAQLPWLQLPPKAHLLPGHTLVPALGSSWQKFSLLQLLPRPREKGQGTSGSASTAIPPTPPRKHKDLVTGTM